MPVGREHGHLDVEDLAGDVLRQVEKRMRDAQRIGLVALCESDRLVPALEEAAHGVGIAGNERVSRIDRVGDEGVDEIGKSEQHAAAIGRLQAKTAFDAADERIDVARNQCGPRAIRAAKRRDLHGLRVLPAFAVIDLAREPVGQRAHGRDADGLALEIGHGLDRLVAAHDQRHVERLGCHHANAFFRRALGDEGDIGACAQRDVDAAGHHRLMQPGRAVDAARLDVETLFLEDPRFEPDIQEHEAESAARAFGDAEVILGARGVTAGGH